MLEKVSWELLRFHFNFPETQRKMFLSASLLSSHEDSIVNVHQQTLPTCFGFFGCETEKQ